MGQVIPLMVGPAAKREAVAHLRGALEMSERRACGLIAADHTDPLPLTATTRATLPCGGNGVIAFSIAVRRELTLAPPIGVRARLDGQVSPCFDGEPPEPPAASTEKLPQTEGFNTEAEAEGPSPFAKGASSICNGAGQPSLAAFAA